jgi:hypothetical protein
MAVRAAGSIPRHQVRGLLVNEPSMNNPTEMLARSASTFSKVKPGQA